MIALFLSLATLPDGAMSKPVGDTAISCRLQIYADVKQPLNPAGRFDPFIIRFFESPAEDAVVDGGNISVFDPQNLLKSLAIKKLSLTRAGVNFIVSTKKLDKMVTFSAINAAIFSDKGRPPGRSEENWIGIIGSFGSGKGASEDFKARGTCKYLSNVGGVSDEDLIIRTGYEP